MTSDKSTMFHKKCDYESRKDLLIHYLKVLYDSNRPKTFSDLLFDNLPTGGIDEFESVLNELENKKLIIKYEKDGGSVSGMPYYRTVDKSYSISLEGVEYLASVGLIAEKHKNTTNANDKTITNYGNMVLGDNPKDINQSSSSDLLDQRLSNNSIAREPSIAKEHPIDTSIIKSNSDFKNILNKIYKWTDHKLVSLIVFSILGFIVARLMTWLGWF